VTSVTRESVRSSRSAGDGSPAEYRKARRVLRPAECGKARRVLRPAAVVLGAIAAAQLIPPTVAHAGATVGKPIDAASTAGPVGGAGLPASRETRELILSLDARARLIAGVHSARAGRQGAGKRAYGSRAVAMNGSTPGSPGCGGTGAIVPQNAGEIVRFLVGHGYTPMAAAGIAGNIYQESQGNPESIGTGGGGLIGWTPLPAGFVTGNPAADLQTQLEALLAYNQQWAAYIPALNAATTPALAADIYMDDFERPGDPAAGNREAAASAVAQACGIAG
jgi:hypothetical protein